MADQEIRQLTEETAVNDSDLYIMQKSANNDTVKVQAQNIVPDGSITAAKIDFGGGGDGVWWEEIGRTTLGVAGDTILVSGLPTRKYLLILAYVTNSGSINLTLRFNGDGANNYAYRTSLAGAADGTADTTSGLQFSASASNDMFGRAYVTNVLAEEKLAIMHSIRNANGITNVPSRLEGVGKWVNTAAAISAVSVFNSSTGDYEAGSQLIVMGHD